MIDAMGRKHRYKKKVRALNHSELGQHKSEINIYQPTQVLAKPELVVSTLKASIIIILVGFVTYFRGIKNPFIGDDIGQIVNNPVVHSITHFSLFFEGSTFYNGGGI